MACNLFIVRSEALVQTLKQSFFLPYSEGAKRRKRIPRGEPHAPASLPSLRRGFYTRSRSFLRIPPANPPASLALPPPPKYDCFAVQFIEYHIAVFMYKYHNQLLSSVFKSFFTKYDYIYSYNTTHASKSSFYLGKNKLWTIQYSCPRPYDMEEHLTNKY